MILSHCFEIVGFFIFSLPGILYFCRKNNMKIKLFLGLAGAVAFFNSCSSDNYEMINPSADKLLLSKITTTYYDDPTKPKTEIETLEYNSQGELIRMQSEAGRNSTFEYSNGKPVKINYYNNSRYWSIIWILPTKEIN